MAQYKFLSDLLKRIEDGGWEGVLLQLKALQACALAAEFSGLELLPRHLQPSLLPCVEPYMRQRALGQRPEGFGVLGLGFANG